MNYALTIPKLSLVVLIGPSGSGKNTFARKHFLPTELLSVEYRDKRSGQTPKNHFERNESALFHRKAIL